mgnify:CR=1 FL=1
MDVIIGSRFSTIISFHSGPLSNLPIYSDWTLDDSRLHVLFLFFHLIYDLDLFIFVVVVGGDNDDELFANANKEHKRQTCVKKNINIQIFKVKKKNGTFFPP